MSTNNGTTSHSPFAVAALEHDLGNHERLAAPAPHCPRCEMTHTRGRYQTAMRTLSRIADAAEDLLDTRATRAESTTSHQRLALSVALLEARRIIRKAERG